MDKKDNNNRQYVSHHILPTASNLLGLCFVILSYIKLSNLSHKTFIDEIVSVLMVSLLISCIFSYASIRAKTNNDLYEKVADIIFMASLVLLSLTAFVVAFEYW